MDITHDILNKTKPLDTNLEPRISNLANGILNLKCNNSVLVQKNLFSLYSNFI